MNEFIVRDRKCFRLAMKSLPFEVMRADAKKVYGPVTIPPHRLYVRWIKIDVRIWRRIYKKYPFIRKKQEAGLIKGYIRHIATKTLKIHWSKDGSSST